jgi:hypothetical protein
MLGTYWELEGNMLGTKEKNKKIAFSFALHLKWALNHS